MRGGRLTLALLVLVLLAGCGGRAKSNGEAAKPSAQIFADAKRAATSAAAVHIYGAVIDHGTHYSLDLRLVRRKGGAGHMSWQGFSFKLVRIGDKAYIYGPDAFYRKIAGAAAAQLFHGRWLEFSAAKGDLAAFARITDVDKFFAAFKSEPGFVKGAQTAVRGQKVIAIRDKRGETMYVATTGRPYPIEVVGPKSSPGKVDFDEWNKPMPLAAPKNAIDISKLNG
jgi:hypothetical protein